MKKKFIAPIYPFSHKLLVKTWLTEKLIRIFKDNFDNDYPKRKSYDLHHVKKVVYRNMKGKKKEERRKKKPWKEGNRGEGEEEKRNDQRN